MSPDPEQIPRTMRGQSRDKSENRDSSDLTLIGGDFTADEVTSTACEHSRPAR